MFQVDLWFIYENKQTESIPFPIPRVYINKDNVIDVR
jgi:hypothetical protein